MDTPKTSTDPQENEIDSNVFGSLFRGLTGNTDPEADKTPEEKAATPKTLDEEQDPATDKTVDKDA